MKKSPRLYLFILAAWLALILLAAMPLMTVIKGAEKNGWFCGSARCYEYGVYYVLLQTA